MNKFKLILAMFFLIVGLACTFLTFKLSNKVSYGSFESPGRSNTSIAGSGVDSSNDGVAVGLGIISGFSFLSSVLLLNNINKK